MPGGRPTNEMNWQTLSEHNLPPEKQPVYTKIDDKDGVRNECQLIRRGNLFFLPDMSMYVYYRPTHWAS